MSDIRNSTFASIAIIGSGTLLLRLINLKQHWEIRRFDDQNGQ